MTLKLFLCGDVMTGRGVDQILDHPGDPQLHEPYVKDARQYVTLAERAHGQIDAPVEASYIWGTGLEYLRQEDPAVRLINLETAITTSDQFWKGKGIHYRMAPRNIGSLTAARIDCCSLANNHVLDWGYVGLHETLETLADGDIRTTGAGMTRQGAEQPALLPVNNAGDVLVVGVATTGSGVPPAWAAGGDRAGVHLLSDLSSSAVTQLAALISRCRRDHQLGAVVVSIHWGSNWGYEVPRSHRNFAHALIDEAQVDIVHGHSSHHVKALELHRGRLILYGCGDLITDYEGISGKEQFRGDLGIMYFPEVEAGSGELKSLRMYPTKVEQMQLTRPPREDLQWLHRTLERECRTGDMSINLNHDGILTLAR